MPRTPKTDPAMADRLRRARQVEDDAVAAVTAAQAALDAATTKRAQTLATLDAKVADADEALAQARNELVDAAGLDRAAHVLGVSVGTLRKRLPTNRNETPGWSAATSGATQSAGDPR